MSKLPAIALSAVLLGFAIYFAASYSFWRAEFLGKAWLSCLVLSLSFYVLSARGRFSGVYLIGRGWPRIPRLVLGAWIIFVSMFSARFLIEENYNFLVVYYLLYGNVLCIYMVTAALSLIFGRGFVGRWVDRYLF